MQHKLFGLRGAAFVSEYKYLYRELEPELRKAFAVHIKENDGKFTPRSLGAIAVEFHLPLTVLDDFLSGYGLIPSGTWERLQARGCKARDIGVVWD